MSRILVTGANGQLGREFQDLAKDRNEHRFFFTDLSDLDIRDAGAIERLLEESSPEFLLNCAAYTAVDRAESEPDLAFAINGDAVGSLAKACRQRGIFLVHFSTDYVFDGNTKTPYKETDPVHPLSVYGKSKLEGESKMLETGPDGMIIRASWMYSSYGNNFVKTILKKAGETGQLKVVNDQTGCPTYAGDLASAVLDILPKTGPGHGTQIYHYAGQGQCSWHEFAATITDIAGIACQIEPIATSELRLAAIRPPFSALDTGKIRKAFGISIPTWQDSLERCIWLINNK